jgi:hypothetical protein
MGKKSRGKKRSQKRNQDEWTEMKVVSVPRRSTIMEAFFPFRFMFESTNGSIAVTVANLLDLVGVCADTDSGTCYRLFRFMRLKRIKLIATAQNVAAGATPYSGVTLAFQNTNSSGSGSGAVYEATCTGTTPGVIEYRPKELELFGRWLSSNDSTASFVINVLGSTACLVEVDLVMRGANNVSIACNSIGSTGLSIGATYYSGLDGNIAISTVCPMIAPTSDLR